MFVESAQWFGWAGAARRDITPPVGIYHRMWGAATHDRSTGVHRPLTCTVLALGPDRGGERPPQSALQLVVAIDHCLLWNDDLERLRATVCKQTGLEAGQLQFALSHTHAAGLMDSSRTDLPGGDLIGPYLATLAERVADAANEALAALQPAGIAYGLGRCGLAANRDFRDTENGLYVCGFNPQGEADDTLVVARICDREQRPLATIVNYACHPTTLAWDNTLISPDYVGATRELVETATGGAPCVFLQGASGDLGPRRGYVGDTEVADRNGRELGHAALAALEALPAAGTRFEYTGPVVSGATIGTWADRPLPPDDLCDKHRWEAVARDIPLPYRPDLPNRELTEEELARWMRAEHEATARGDSAAARDCRAHVERMARQLSRLRMLPSGPTVGLRAAVWRLGDAIWVFVAGEHYQELQRHLRARFAEHIILVATVTNGWLPGYLPTAETYGQGIYQESIAVVAAGSLERVIEEVAREIERLV